MNIARGLNKPTRAYTYTLVTPPATTPVSLDDVKSQLKISGSAEDDLLTLYINAATSYAEKFTGRDFISRTYKTFRDSFFVSENYYTVQSIEIMRSPLQSVTSINYKLDNVLTLLSSSAYYNTVEADYSSILPTEGYSWPSADDTLQSIEIVFVSGYGDAASDVPADIRLAIMQHVCSLYANRGDCSCATESALPASAKSIYMQYRIINF